MDGKDWTLVIGVVFTGLISLVGTVFSGLAMLYAAQAKAKGDENHESIKRVEHSTNGMKDSLVRAAGDKGFAAGEAGQTNPTK